MNTTLLWVAVVKAHAILNVSVAIVSATRVLKTQNILISNRIHFCLCSSLTFAIVRFELSLSSPVVQLFLLHIISIKVAKSVFPLIFFSSKMKLKMSVVILFQLLGYPVSVQLILQYFIWNEHV